MSESGLTDILRTVDHSADRSRQRTQERDQDIARSLETRLPPMALDKGTRDELRRAGSAVTKWTKERDRRIRAAVASGASLREVGAAVGLSHTAVKFIAHGRA